MENGATMHGDTMDIERYPSVSLSPDTIPSPPLVEHELREGEPISGSPKSDPVDPWTKTIPAPPPFDDAPQTLRCPAPGAPSFEPLEREVA